jgi:hypothetical protein
VNISRVELTGNTVLTVRHGARGTCVP